MQRLGSDSINRGSLVAYIRTQVLRERPEEYFEIVGLGVVLLEERDQVALVALQLLLYFLNYLIFRDIAGTRHACLKESR